MGKSEKERMAFARKKLKSGQRVAYGVVAMMILQFGYSALLKAQEN